MPYPQRSYLYYRHYYRKLVAMAFVQCLLIATLLGITFFQLVNLPQPVYFATTTDGRVVPISK
jgi:intracellular multiplication protein IcmL